MSYVNRMALGEVNLTDMQAFIMLRQLDLKLVEKARRSLASKVLAPGADGKKKHYPINYVEEEPEDVHMAQDEELI